MSHQKQKNEARIGGSGLNAGLGWNRCDICGKYIAIKNFDSGIAVRTMVTPDSDYSTEDYETLCEDHIDA